MREAPPARIRAMHLADQRADVIGDRRSPGTGLRGTPAPMPGEEATMPGDDGGGLHDLHGIPPAAPHSGEHDPHESVGPTEPEATWCGPLEDGELVPEGDDLRCEFGARSEAETNRREKGNDAWAHGPCTISAGIA